MPFTREEQLSRRRDYYQANKQRLQEEARTRAAGYRKQDPEGVRQDLAKWRAENSERAKKWARESHAERLKDPEKLAQKRLHSILASSVRSGTQSRFAEGAAFLVWLQPEAQAVLGNTVQIDHLTPLAAFDMQDESQRAAANAASNVWWLPRRANRMKGHRPPTDIEKQLHSELQQLFFVWKSNNTTQCREATTPILPQACSRLKPALISRKKIEILRRLKQELFSTRLLRPETSPSSKTPSK